MRLYQHYDITSLFSINARKITREQAEKLAVVNMGVNIIEIIALFMSSMFSLNAVRWCFIMVGIVLIFSAVLFGRNQKVR